METVSLANASKDQTLRLWKINTEEAINHPVRVRVYKSSVQSVAAQAHGGMICSGSWDCTINLWRINDFNSEDDLVSKKRKVEGQVEDSQLEALKPDQESKKEGEVNDEVPTHDESLQPLKRLRLRGQEAQSSRLLTSRGPSSAAFPLKAPKLEPDTIPESSSRSLPQSTTMLSDGNARIGAHQVQPRDATVDKGKQPVSPQNTPRGRGFMSDKTPLQYHLKNQQLNQELLQLHRSPCRNSKFLAVPPVLEFPFCLALN